MLFRRIHTLIPCLLLALGACQAHRVERGTPAPELASTTTAAPALTCAPPLRTCFHCNDGTPYCAIRCPECAPQEGAPATGAAATLALAEPGCLSAADASGVPAADR